MSAILGCVPGLLRPSVISELYTISKDFQTKSRIEKYCSVAQKLCEQGCVYSAVLPLSLARRAVHIYIENDSFSQEDRIECLCKISQVASFLNPNRISSDLELASLLASQASEKKKNIFHFLWSTVHFEMGSAFLAAGEKTKAKENFALARNYAQQERPLESVSALCNIAAKEKEVDIEAAKVTLAIAQRNVSGMWAGSSAKVHSLVAISDLYFSFDPQTAAQMCNLAQSDIVKMDGTERDRSQKLVAEALVSRRV